jgi:hypothetical protein
VPVGPLLPGQADGRDAPKEHRHLHPGPRQGPDLCPGLGGPGVCLPPVERESEIDPNFWLAHRFLGWAYLLQGKAAEGVTAFEKAHQLTDDSVTLAGLGYAYAATGMQVKAKEVLYALTDLANQRYVSPDCQALVAIGLGDKDLAFSWLGKAVEDRSEWLCKIRVDPVLDSLRSDPRFEALLRRMDIRW